MKRGERFLSLGRQSPHRSYQHKDGVVYAKAENNGKLMQRKGINLPDTDFGGDVITAKDKADLVLALPRT